LKAVERFRFAVVNVEHGQQLRDGQQILQLLREIEQFELAAFFADGSVARHQLADAAGIDVAHAGQVQENALLAFLKQTPDSGAQRDTAFPNRDLSAHVENGYVSCLTFVDIQLSHCQKSPL